jgi:hypothetical protein
MHGPPPCRRVASRWRRAVVVSRLSISLRDHSTARYLAASIARRTRLILKLGCVSVIDPSALARASITPSRVSERLFGLPPSLYPEISASAISFPHDYRRCDVARLNLLSQLFSVAERFSEAAVMRKLTRGLKYINDLRERKFRSDVDT